MGDSIWYEYKLKKNTPPQCVFLPLVPSSLVPRALMPSSLVPSCPHPSFICLRIFGGIKKRINNEKGVIGDIGERVFGDFSAKFVGVM